MAKVCVRTSAGKIVCGQPVRTSLSGIEGNQMTCRRYKVGPSGKLRCADYGAQSLKRGEPYPDSTDAPHAWKPKNRPNYAYRGPKGESQYSRGERMRNMTEDERKAWGRKMKAAKARAKAAREGAVVKPKKGKGKRKAA